MTKPSPIQGIAINDRISQEVYGPVGEADMPEPPTHCRCGRRLIRYIEQDGYTPSGEKVGTVTWRCPRTIGWFWRGFLLSAFVFHDEYEPDQFIDWHWRKRHYQ